MNPWYDTDNLLTEMMGLNRNVLMAVFVFGFVLWQIAEFLVKLYVGEKPGFFFSILPLGGTGAFCYFVLIPTIRRWNDRLPKGYFEGVSDFYFFNTDVLEVANDPEPLPMYLPKTPGTSARQPGT